MLSFQCRNIRLRRCATATGILFLCTAMALLSACSRVPKGVIAPEEMSQLMADVHTAEAVIDMNRSIYMSDSVKQAFKQSVFARHGVTQADFDSSMMWYGRNITKYMDVYDRTIEILEHRIIESGNRVAAEAALSIAGDSVDVWPYAGYLQFTDRVPSHTVTFAFNSDDNWERGDVYVWRAKFFNNGDKSSQWTIACEYDDGTLEYISQTISGDGWKELTFYTDSLRTASRLYGFLEAANRRGTTLAADSIEMVRKRVDPEKYSRRYAIRKMHGVLPKTGNQ